MKDPALEARARALSAELRCMVCQNQSIDDSDAPLARDIRVLIRQRIARARATTRSAPISFRATAISSCSSRRSSRRRCCLWLIAPLTLAAGLAAVCLRAGARPSHAGPERGGGRAARGADGRRETLNSRRLEGTPCAPTGLSRSSPSPAFWPAPAPTAALASSCNRIVVVRIEMAPGQACWTYRGAATMFVGDFF